MLHNYLTTCGAQRRIRMSVENAKEQAGILSQALCPTPKDVTDTRDKELVAFFVDGQEYPPSLVSLTRRCANTGLKEAS